MGDESLIKVIFYFLLVSIGAGLVQMKIPLFGRHSNGGKNKIMHSGLAVSFFGIHCACSYLFI